MTKGKFMKGKILALIAIAALASCLVGCSSGGSTSSGSTQTAEQKAPLDLTGSWVQNNATSSTTMEADVSGDVITVNWVNGDTKSIYWVGSYSAPTTSDTTYSWDSQNDKSQTSKALLASGDDTKTFSYENGTLSFPASAKGTTTTVKMAKE